MAEFQFENTDPSVTLEIQVGSDHSGPVVMIGTYTTSPDKMDALLQSWTVLAHIMRAQPGLLFCQVHRGIGGASVLMNYAVWESLSAFRSAFDNPAFWEAAKNVPEGVVARSLLVERIAVPNVCVA